MAYISFHNLRVIESVNKPYKEQEQMVPNVAEPVVVNVGNKNNPDIKWNFTKFVVDRNGDVVERFEPTAKMEEVEKCVASLI